MSAGTTDETQTGNMNDYKECVIDICDKFQQLSVQAIQQTKQYELLEREELNQLRSAQQHPLKLVDSQELSQSAPIELCCGIRDVWNYNVEKEFVTIRQVVQKYKYIAMDTEFPGLVARAIGDCRKADDFQYQQVRCNTDVLRLIQLGLTFMDEKGNLAPDNHTWQFHFRFNIDEDMYAQNSIDLLLDSGIPFDRLCADGIDPQHFAELITSSGAVLCDDIYWVCFHSCYDFGYMLKLLSGKNLPTTEIEFFELIRLWFPNIYDVKFLCSQIMHLNGGLQEIADNLNLQRVGPRHQAGSDALLTGKVFFKLKITFFQGRIDNEKYCGQLYGLNTVHTRNGQLQVQKKKKPSSPRYKK